MSRCLVLFPDQLDPRYVKHLALDPARDRLLLVECVEDYRHVPSHVQRAILLVSALRHFAAERAAEGWRVQHHRLGQDGPEGLAALLEQELARSGARQVLALQPGEWRQARALEQACAALGLPLELHEDPHFLCTRRDFAAWAEGRKRWVMEHFYRFMRRRTGVLMDAEGEPISGRWNFDAENRMRLGPDGPRPPEPLRFAPDAITRQVMRDVAEQLPDLPGRAEGFAWPVDGADAERALEDFVTHRLPHFGDFQDAMLGGQPWLFHSLLSPALNLKLLDPRRCIEAAVAAWDAGRVPLNAVEGFVRQILGWREFVRGVYFVCGPDYAERNALDQHGRLPELYWTGETDMACVAAALGQVLEQGYGHHIQRLMVTGNLALMAGVHPRAVSDWYLGMYVDAFDWVTLPNALGMVMHADGGTVGTKPYVSSGRYIQRMSDHCQGCRYRPDRRLGEDACPFGSLYWAFLDRNRMRLAGNSRMRLALRNLERIESSELEAIRQRAARLREAWGTGPIEAST